jgi:general secretion pathway protein D
VGSEGVFISKIISDERTNSIILMANEEALSDVTSLVAKLDVDIDPASRSQIHVVYLENAKAEDIASVLQDLSQSSSGSSRSSSSASSSSRSSGSRSNSGSSGSRSNSGSRGGSSGGGGSRSSGGGFGGGMPGGAPGDPPGLGGGTGGTGSTGVVAAFDNGMRVTADENTNSLVVIAAPEDFRVLKQVIDKLDIMRRQVFVEAVVLEIGSEDEFDFGIGYHLGSVDGSGTTSFGSSQLNGSSVGLNLADALSGLAMGVFGQNIDIPYTDSTTGQTSTLAIPAFGIAINALASNSGVDILSNPSLLIVDNEEAKINVGRNVPFPISSGRDSNNNPVVSYQREDVGIELKVTPQINEANFVTMELTLTVAEVEEDSSGLDVSTAGFITSERETENVVVVQDNQTIVIGGLIGNTQTRVETKVPILGDIPLIGALFRGNRNTERKTNLLIFMTPHVINEPADLEEVYRVKWLQRQEFIRRFYGKSRDEQQAELGKILAGSMNMIDQPSQYRVKAIPVPRDEMLGGSSTTTILPTSGTVGGKTTPEPAPAPVVTPPAGN